MADEARDRGVAGTLREVVQIAQYDDGRTPADGAPDRVVETERWYEADGREITDPARIAVIRAAQGVQACS